MATRLEDGLFVVVNAARKEADLAHLRDRLGSATTVELLEDRALLALQGPAAAAVLSRFDEGIARLGFMTAMEAAIGGCEMPGHPVGLYRRGWVRDFVAGGWMPGGRRNAACPAAKCSRSASAPAIRCASRQGSAFTGMTSTRRTTPIEAGLAWTIGKRRRAEGGFPGAALVLRQLAEGAARSRVGIRPDVRAPAREDTPIVDTDGKSIGRVTSGGFGPSLGGPIAMGYVDRRHAAEGTTLVLLVRGVPRPARVVRLPFVPARYYRG